MFLKILAIVIFAVELIRFFLACFVTTGWKPTPYTKKQGVEGLAAMKERMAAARNSGQGMLHRFADRNRGAYMGYDINNPEKATHNRENTRGTRLMYTPTLIAVLGVCVQFFAHLDPTNVAYLSIIVVTAALMMADYTKILMRQQVESVIQAFIWVPAACFSAMIVAANYKRFEKLSSNDDENKGGTEILWYIAVVVIANIVYLAVQGVKRLHGSLDFKLMGFDDPDRKSADRQTKKFMYNFAWIIMLIIPVLYIGLFFTSAVSTVMMAADKDVTEKDAVSCYHNTKNGIITFDLIARIVYYLAHMAFNQLYGHTYFGAMLNEDLNKERKEQEEEFARFKRNMDENEYGKDKEGIVKEMQLPIQQLGIKQRGGLRH